MGWSKDDLFGAEFAQVVFYGDTIAATGVAIGVHPEPYRLDYILTTGREYLTHRLTVKVAGEGWQRKLALQRNDGRWHAEVEQHGEPEFPDAGGDLKGLNDALDPDLGLSPLFNSMPVLRHRIHAGGDSQDFLMVWISVPDLSLHASPQRYRHIESSGDTHVVRFDAVGEGERFTADVIFDDDGLVLDYPGIGERLRPTPG